MERTGDGKATLRFPDFRPHVVIIGGGFGGLTAARSLAKAPVRITLIDRTNHHLFQPLLYQVAMAGLSPADIASPIRSILRKQKNATVLLGEVQRVDLATRTVVMEEGNLTYDYLIIATGAETAYFGHDEWVLDAPGLKSLDDAIEIRQRVLLAFERAEREPDPEVRKRLLSFVVIGGGPTGVELAGALAELSRFVLARDFRSVNPRAAEVHLLEGGPRILPTFSPELSASAVEQLSELGVHVRTGAMVKRIGPCGVYLDDEVIPASIVIWAAGVQAAPLTRTLGVKLDRAGRVEVNPDLSIPGYPNVFVIGDAALFLHQGGKPLPGVSPVAMQQARAVAESIRRTLNGKPRKPFRYIDKGSMATIGRSRAIAEIDRLKLRGLVAWLAWLVVHIWYLIGFRNRLVVMLTWFWSYVTYKRGARLITGYGQGVRVKPAALAARELASKERACSVERARVVQVRAPDRAPDGPRLPDARAPQERSPAQRAP